MWYILDAHSCSLGEWDSKNWFEEENVQLLIPGVPGHSKWEIKKSRTIKTMDVKNSLSLIYVSVSGG